LSYTRAGDQVSEIGVPRLIYAPTGEKMSERVKGIFRLPLGVNQLCRHD